MSKYFNLFLNFLLLIKKILKKKLIIKCVNIYLSATKKNNHLKVTNSTNNNNKNET